jgi:hypothetical protein
MKISRISIVVGTVFLIFSILSLAFSFNAWAGPSPKVKYNLKQMRAAGAPNSYVLSGPDAVKTMEKINAQKKDCCSCRKVGSEIICAGKGSSDCCVKVFESLGITK